MNYDALGLSKYKYKEVDFFGNPIHKEEQFVVRKHNLSISLVERECEKAKEYIQNHKSEARRHYYELLKTICRRAVNKYRKREGYKLKTVVNDIADLVPICEYKKPEQYIIHQTDKACYLYVRVKRFQKPALQSISIMIQSKSSKNNAELRAKLKESREER